MRSAAAFVPIALLALLPAQSFSASLDGGQMPVPTGSSAAGWAVVRLQANREVAITVDVDGLPGAAACELRHGGPGQTGPLILALGGGAKTWTGGGTLSLADAQALAAGTTHLVVATPVFPAGEIRGQVVPPRAQRFLARLEAGSLVPPQPFPFTGEIDAFLFEPDDRLVVVIARALGQRDVQEYRLRLGAAGANGAVLHTFLPQNSQDTSAGATRKLTGTELQTLRAGGLYVEVFGQPYAGQPLQPLLRGQLLPAPNAFAGSLTGAQVVPPSGVAVQAFAACYPQDAAGNWTFWVDRHGFHETACHVRHGLPGTNGTILFSLGSHATKWLGERLLTAVEVAQVQNGEWYFERATNTLAQEVRAQIVPSVMPATSYGDGCADSNGTNWYLVAAQGVACPGAQTLSAARFVLKIVAHGPRPLGGLGYLAIGFRNDRNGALALPLRLDVAGGSPDCYLLTEAVVALAAQSFGTTWDRLSFPSDGSLRGLSMYAQSVLFDPAAPGYFAASNALAILVQ